MGTRRPSNRMIIRSESVSPDMHVLAKPYDDGGRSFEQQCLTIFSRRFHTARANFYGQRGVGQDGIDILMRASVNGSDTLVVIQCKDCESVHWSTFSDDFKGAVRAFAPRGASEPGLLFVLATTASGVNSRDIRLKARDALAGLGAEIDGLDTRRVDHIEYAWPEIENIVNGSDELRRLFYAQYWPADVQQSKQLDEFEDGIKSASRALDLHSAQRLLQQYRAEQHLEPLDFKWVRTRIMKELTNVFLNAGDFESVAALLDYAVPLHPLDSTFLLGHLRARRLLKAFPRDGRNRFAFPGGPSVQQAVAKPLRSVEEEVDAQASALLAAMGTLDEQLTLALWVITYTTDPVIADHGLLRASGLIVRDWPADVPMLCDGERYAVTFFGGLCREEEGDRLKTPAGQEVYACVLATAYHYLRMVHAYRFGSERTLSVEAETESGLNGGIADLFGKSIFDFFSANLNPRVRKGCVEHLTHFYGEARGREFLWPVCPEFVSWRRPLLPHRRYACGHTFLLRDCADGFIEKRFLELAKSGFLSDGTTLVTAHLELEQIVRVQCARRLALARSDQDVEYHASMLAQIDRLSNKVVRIESGIQSPANHNVVSYPCYSRPVHARPSIPALELCIDHGLLYLSASNREHESVEVRLDQERIIKYWVPEGVSFIEARQGMR